MSNKNVKKVLKKITIKELSEAYGISGRTASAWKIGKPNTKRKILFDAAKSYYHLLMPVEEGGVRCESIKKKTEEIIKDLENDFSKTEYIKEEAIENLQKKMESLYEDITDYQNKVEADE